MRILIIRHGEPDYSIDGLTEKGHREAKLLSLRLKETKLDQIYVSPLGRAQETCRYTLEAAGKTAVTLPWLQEFRGKTFDPDRGVVRIPWDYRAFRWRGDPALLNEDTWCDHPIFEGGTVGEIWEETKAGLDAVLKANGYEREGRVYRVRERNMRTLAFFCHFGIGSAILSHLTGIPLMALWHGTCWLPTGVTTVVTQERDEGIADFRCVCLGDLTHLAIANEPASLFGMFPEVYNGCDCTSPTMWPESDAKAARPLT